MVSKWFYVLLNLIIECFDVSLNILCFFNSSKSFQTFSFQVLCFFQNSMLLNILCFLQIWCLMKKQFQPSICVVVFFKNRCFSKSSMFLKNNFASIICVFCISTSIQPTNDSIHNKIPVNCARNLWENWNIQA